MRPPEKFTLKIWMLYSFLAVSHGSFGPPPSRQQFLEALYEEPWDWQADHTFCDDRWRLALTRKRNPSCFPEKLHHQHTYLWNRKDNKYGLGFLFWPRCCCNDKLCMYSDFMQMQYDGNSPHAHVTHLLTPSPKLPC